MPVVIDYNPVSAVSTMAQNAYRASERPQGQQFQQGPNLRNYSQQQQGSTAPSIGGTYFNNATGETTDENGRLVGKQQPALQDYQIEQTGTDAATGQDASMPGGSVRVNAQQRTQLDNLKATGVTGDAFNQGLRKIMGLPEPEEPKQDYTMTGPDGQTYQMKLTPKELINANNLGYKQLHGQQAIELKGADLQRKQEQDAARGETSKALVDIQSQRVALESRRLDILDAGNDPKAQAALRKEENDIDDREKAAELQAAGGEIDYAQKDVNDFVQRKGQNMKVDDPELIRLQQVVLTALKAKQGIVDKWLKVAQAKKAAAMAPPDATPKTGGVVPDYTNNNATVPSAGAAPVKYSRTATGPKGEKIGLNPDTNQWEPLK